MVEAAFMPHTVAGAVAVVIGYDFEVVGLEPAQVGLLCLTERCAFRVENLKRHSPQAAVFDQCRVFGPERSGGGVPGVLEQRLARDLQGRVDPLEVRRGHVDLASDNDESVVRILGS